MPIEMFDPARDPHGHAPIVFAQFADGANLERHEGARVLRRLLAAGARCAIWYPAHDPWVMVGFAIAGPDPQSVVWCWTRPRNRTTKEQREQGRRNGVMTDLLAYLGVDLRKPVTARYSSLAGHGIARRHPITFLDNPTQKAATI